MTLVFAVLAVVVLGIAHYFALLAIRRLSPAAETSPILSVVANFTCLVLLHTLEILAFAGLYGGLIQWGWVPPLGGGNSWSDLVYFSGINFITLGYTDLEASGNLRLLSMMQSLGGLYGTDMVGHLHLLCEQEQLVERDGERGVSSGVSHRDNR